MLAEVEHICCGILIAMWIAWIVRFSWQAHQASVLEPAPGLEHANTHMYIMYTTVNVYINTV